MNSLLMIVPSRSRPGNIAELAESWRDTVRGISHLRVAVDEDDPRLGDYRSLSVWDVFTLRVGPRKRLGGTLNDAATEGLMEGFSATGFCGDDHRFRSMAWDQRFLTELDRLGTGVVYGNDLIHGPGLPTAVAMTSDIIQALGCMVPGGLVHMYIDNAWKAWGEGIGRLSYLPDVILEHVHPLVGKAPDDALYQETQTLMGPDCERWEAYKLTGGLDADVERLNAMIAMKAACP